MEESVMADNPPPNMPPNPAKPPGDEGGYLWDPSDTHGPGGHPTGYYKDHLKNWWLIRDVDASVYENIPGSGYTASLWSVPNTFNAPRGKQIVASDDPSGIVEAINDYVYVYRINKGDLQPGSPWKWILILIGLYYADKKGRR